MHTGFLESYLPLQEVDVDFFTTFCIGWVVSLYLVFKTLDMLIFLHVFLLYISSYSLKKRLKHAYGLTLMSFFIKIMMGNYETWPIITPNSFFFKGVIKGHNFWWYGTALPETDFTFWKFITCSSLLAKQISHY